VKKICVFCGSSPGAGSVYSAAAESLGQVMVEQQIDLVYGGASIGVMGTIANTVLRHGGKAYGVIPEHLQGYEISHPGLTELHVVPSMHERKALMASLSDGFIALPGGIGTLEELIEIITWQQLGLHRKPVGVLNVNNFFASLNQFLDHCVTEQFLQAEHRANLLCEDNATTLLKAMDSFVENFVAPVLKIPEPVKP